MEIVRYLCQETVLNRETAYAKTVFFFKKGCGLIKNQNSSLCMGCRMLGQVARYEENQFLKGLICIFKEFILFSEDSGKQLRRFLYHRIEAGLVYYKDYSRGSVERLCLETWISTKKHLIQSTGDRMGKGGLDRFNVNEV